MKKMIGVLVIGICLTLCGCAGNTKVIKSRATERIDPISITDQEYANRVIDECAKYTKAEIDRMQREIIVRAMLGAVIGAGIGYAVGSTFNNDTAKYGANWGAATGAVSGAASTPNKSDIIMGNCLINRGLRLLW
jgi:hypothetical protein